MGFVSPSTYAGSESPRPPRLTGLAFRRHRKIASAFAGRSHPTGYGAAHRLSQPLSDFFLSLPSCRFQAGDVHGVRPSGISSLHKASNDSSPLEYPLAVPPAGCAAPRS
jgi:hypothetical protein